jgi:hypothetical protein
MGRFHLRVTCDYELSMGLDYNGFILYLVEAPLVKECVRQTYIEAKRNNPAQTRE